MAGTLAQEITDILQDDDGGDGDDDDEDGDNSPHNVECLGTSAVRFVVSDPVLALRVLLWSRIAHRIMQHLTTCENVYDRDSLYTSIQNHIQVVDLLYQDDSWLSISVQVIPQRLPLPQDLRHSHFTALTIKNALCDAARDYNDDRPMVDTTETCDVPLIAMLSSSSPANHYDDEAPVAAQVTLYRCLHPPGSLHKRGYRVGQSIHKAAMKESMAAGLLRHAGWHDLISAKKQQQQRQENDQKTYCLVDPMAGSGTLLLEGILMAADFAPGLMRLKQWGWGRTSLLPPMVRWNSHHHHHDLESAWNKLLVQAAQRAKQGLQVLQSQERQIYFYGNDFHTGALDLFHHALEQAGLQDCITELRQGNCADWNLSSSLLKTTGNDDISKVQCLVVTNPPWGVRLTEDMETSWDELRIFLRQQCPPDTHAWVLSGNKDATRFLRLRRTQSIPIQTGQQSLRWIHYHILSDGAVARQKQQQKIAETPARNDWQHASDITVKGGPFPETAVANGGTQQRQKHNNNNNVSRNTQTTAAPRHSKNDIGVVKNSKRKHPKPPQQQNPWLLE